MGSATHHDRITATEATRLARMSPDRLLRRLRAGDIDGELVAGRWVVSRSSLERYLRRHASPEPIPTA
jgi:hypothetical protein